MAASNRLVEVSQISSSKLSAFSLTKEKALARSVKTREEEGSPVPIRPYYGILRHEGKPQPFRTCENVSLDATCRLGPSDFATLPLKSRAFPKGQPLSQRQTVGPASTQVLPTIKVGRTEKLSE